MPTTKGVFHPTVTFASTNQMPATKRIFHPTGCTCKKREERRSWCSITEVLKEICLFRYMLCVALCRILVEAGDGEGMEASRYGRTRR